MSSQPTRLDTHMATKLGRYQLIKKIATGGMAEIFLAKLEGVAGFEKIVIIKKILPQWSQDPQFVSMLIDEAKISVQLTHPAIVQIYELGREGETYYIVMEYVQGVDLRKLLAKAQALKKKIPQDVALFMVSEVLEALSYAHQKQDPQGQALDIIHRDISPQNILVSLEGSVKLTDFGIAKAATRHQETMTGVLKGKFAYMSPEQANQETLDQRTDLYALAIVLYELLTQERLFYRGSDIETLDRVRRGTVNFSEHAEQVISPELKTVLLKALSKNPEERYSDAQTFREALHHCAPQSGKARNKTAGFVKELFASEFQAEVQELSHTATAALESTRTSEIGEISESQVLVTRVIPQVDSTQVFVQQAKSSPVFWAFIAVIVSVTATLYFFLQPEEKIQPIKVSQNQAPVVVKSLPKPQPAPTTIKTNSETVSQSHLVKEANAVETPTVIESPKEKIQKLQTVKSENQKVGYLNVNASPWGMVSVDGKSQQETPIIRLPLAEGIHQVVVEYEPEQQKLVGQVAIKALEEKKCIATFRDKERKLRCD